MIPPSPPSSHTLAKARPTVATIIQMLAERDLLAGVAIVCRMYHVLPEEALGNGRSKQVCAGRRAIYAHLRELGFSLTEVGALLGRDHTTILYGIRKAA